MKLIIILFLSFLVVSGCKTESSDNQEYSKEDIHEVGEAKTNQFWWPNSVNLSPLRQHAKESSPANERFVYAKEFNKLNLKQVKKDIEKVLTDSQDWWPADWGNYGPFFIRMAWHSAGTYRVTDGRGGSAGGQLRFDPQNSWPDNGNLDKARRLLWPVKKKYGKKLSWADLMVLAGNVSLESMGFQTLGFAGGRTDDWEPDLVYWGPETEMQANHRRDKKGRLKKPLGAVKMGLIYVNPEGPNGKPDPLLSAKAIRESFGRMAMNDEETAALIAGGHTFGKAHGARKEKDCVGHAPADAPIENQGFGHMSKCGKGHSEDTMTSGLEGAWTSTPTKWSMQYLEFLYAFEWELTTSPQGAKQWKPKGKSGDNLVPDAHIKGKRNPPMMFTTDLALKFDPEYRKITQRWLKNPKEFERAFARAWFKLTHRDMGPRARYLGSEVPKEELSWQDPIPRRTSKLISNGDAARLKKKILSSGLSTSELIRTAWASAGSYRATDMRGGANGARVRLAPQNEWEVNNPTELNEVIKKLNSIRMSFKKSLPKDVNISLADTIVLAGHAAVEKASKDAGVIVKVDFDPGRTDASQEQTNIESFSHLEPKADGFRNYFSKESHYKPIIALIDRANMLNLTIPEMTVLIGGLRVLGANSQGSKHGVFTNRVGTLSNDFFVNLLDMSTKWEKSKTTEGVYNGLDRKTGKQKYTATPVDLVFGSSSELRAVAEFYAADDGKVQFVKDFVKAWSKIMTADRFDLKY